jgi:hypothetical protein
MPLLGNEISLEKFKNLSRRRMSYIKKKNIKEENLLLKETSFFQDKLS